MCYRPLKLRNLSKEFSAGNDFITCSCRKCDECHSIASSEYVTRSVVMYDKLVGHGYDAYFVTFTFNPDSLPYHTLYKRVDVSDGVSSSSWQPCGRVATFDHDLLKRFKNSLNRYFNRLGLPKFHFLFTSEYGSDKGRPHYHANLFLPSLSTFPYSAYKSLVEGACARFNASEGKCYNSITIPHFKVVQHLLLNYWKYGFIKNEMYKSVLTDDGKVQRTVFNALRYVTKYVSKYSSSVPCFVSNPKDFCLDIFPHRYMPRVFTSDGYGDPLHHLDEDLYIKGKFKKFFDGSWRTFKIPSYYIYKHFTRINVVDKPHIVLQRHNSEPYFMTDEYRRKVVRIASKLNLSLPEDAVSLEECRLLVASVQRVEHDAQYYVLRSSRFENQFKDFKVFLESVLLSSQASPLRSLFSRYCPVSNIRRLLDDWVYLEDYEYWIFASHTPNLIHTELWLAFQDYLCYLRKERELSAIRKREEADLFYKSHQKVNNC